MEWKKTPEKLVKFFEEKTAGIECERRKMFGFPCCFINGNMFTGTFEETIFLRLSKEDRERVFAEKKDVRSFEPRKGKPMGEYVVVPERIKNQTALFDRLLMLSVDYAGSLPPKKKRKGK